MDLYLITGASKGLGLALAQEALAQGHHVVGFSRTSPPLKQAGFSHIKVDLTKSKTSLKIFQKTLKSLDLETYHALHLVNNAAVIEPIDKLERQAAQDLLNHFQINVLSPLGLTRLLLAHKRPRHTWVTVTNLSSGAALRPIQSWTAYCASKAALRMATDCLALEYKDTRLRFLNFAPGLVDTQMQSLLRKKSATQFPQVQDFRLAKKSGQLLDPRIVSRLLIDVLKNPKKIRSTWVQVQKGELKWN